MPKSKPKLKRYVATRLADSELPVIGVYATDPDDAYIQLAKMLGFDDVAEEVVLYEFPDALSGPTALTPVEE